jgi:hypothetical protein
LAFSMYSLVTSRVQARPPQGSSPPPGTAAPAPAPLADGGSDLIPLPPAESPVSKCASGDPIKWCGSGLATSEGSVRSIARAAREDSEGAPFYL